MKRTSRGESRVKARESVVHRFFKSDDKYDSQYSVRLMDGKVLKKVLNTKLGTPDDFFFLREGDTVVYSGDKVIEIRFKREASIKSRFYSSLFFCFMDRKYMEMTGFVLKNSMRNHAWEKLQYQGVSGFLILSGD
ncbi:MAG: hypothetical protein ACLU99_08475 [Alphaproteobacteria bacterium]